MFTTRRRKETDTQQARGAQSCGSSDGRAVDTGAGMLDRRRDRADSDTHARSSLHARGGVTSKQEDVMKRQDLQMVSLESHSQVHAYISLESSKSLLGPSSVGPSFRFTTADSENMTLRFRKFRSWMLKIGS